MILAANSIVSLGLKAAGYEYVNSRTLSWFRKSSHQWDADSTSAVVDCWNVKSGRNATTGRLILDSTKFLDGISGIAAKIHALGLKMGIYSSEITGLLQ